MAEKQLTEIKKYAVFSKITFTQSEQVLLGVAGEKADNAVQSRYIGDGDVRATQTGTAVRIEANRWLLAMDATEADALLLILASVRPFAITVSGRCLNFALPSRRLSW